MTASIWTDGRRCSIIRWGDDSYFTTFFLVITLPCDRRKARPGCCLQPPSVTPWRDVLRMFVDTFAITGNAKPSLPWILPMKRFGFIPYKVHCVIMEIISAVFVNLANLVNNQIIYAICPCMLLKQLKTIGEYMLEIIKTFSARWIIARDYTLSCRRADARSDWQARMAVLVIRPSLFASHFRPSERHRFCMTE